MNINGICESKNLRLKYDFLVNDIPGLNDVFLTEDPINNFHGELSPLI